MEVDIEHILNLFCVFGHGLQDTAGDIQKCRKLGFFGLVDGFVLQDQI